MSKKIGVVGLMPGDEGKANIASIILKLAHDSLPQASYSNGVKPVMVERFQGGGNAGHTFWWNGQEIKTHLVPMGIAAENTYNLSGEGMFIDVRRVVSETAALREKGIHIGPENFGIASNAHVTLDYHTGADNGLEKNGKVDHVSTGSGIKQTSVDKYGRVGIRFAEFLDADLMKSILLEKRFPQGEGFPKNLGSIDQFVASYDEVREDLAKYLVLQTEVRKKHGDHVWIGEGAQGAVLDIDVGMYPGITSSNPILVPNRPDLIIGVIKSYLSTVGFGDRPFITQMSPDDENTYRKEWGEFGTKTGKPRGVGWLCLPELRYHVATSQVDYLGVTCGDRLTAIHQRGNKIQLCIELKVNGNTYDNWDASFHKRNVLFEAEPVYKEFEPWETLFQPGTNKLSSNADKFYDYLQKRLDKEILLYGNGPKPEDIKVMQNPLDLIR